MHTNFRERLKLFFLFMFAIGVTNGIDSNTCNAGEAEGKWLMQKNNSDSFDRAINIQGSSFISLITTNEGAAYESGWWTENPGNNGHTAVIVRYGDNPPDTIEYQMQSPNKAIIWLAGETEPWGSMNRIQCSLSLQYRNKSDLPPEGCAWLHIRGWGYSALDGECLYNEDWVNLPDNAEAPMECLIEAPATMVR